MNATDIYRGSNGDETRRFYVLLEKRGAIGSLAVNLFRAQKNSSRAKKYHGGIKGVRSYRSLAYDRKNWALAQLCECLRRHAERFKIEWGWKRDSKTIGFEWVLYVDLPNGQVSFHSAERLNGPDYRGKWDESRSSAERIIAFCDQVLAENDSQPKLLLGDNTNAIQETEEASFE